MTPDRPQHPKHPAAGNGTTPSLPLRIFWLTAAAALVAALAPRAARAEIVPLQELVGSAGTALGVLLAEAEYNSAYEDWNRERSEKGWKLSVSAGYGTERDLIDETRSRSFESIRTKVSLGYPLLGARAREEREVESAAGRVQEKRIQRDAALAVAGLEIEEAYATAWGAQEALEVIEAFLAGEARFGSGDADDAGTGYTRARRQARRIARLRTEAVSRLEQLTARKLPDFTAIAVQLPKIAGIDLKRLERDHPELATLRALHGSARSQLDGSVWYGIDAGFDLTQSTVQDRSDGQAGNGLFANFNVSLPLTFYQAGIAERRKLRAEMAGLELKLKEKGDEIIGGAEQAQAEHLDLFDEVETLTQRTQSAGRALRRDGGGDALARRARNYYVLAVDELDARTRYWRSHIALRRLVPVGAAEPAPVPPGPETTDVGTRLAEPLTRVARSS